MRPPRHRLSPGMRIAVIGSGNIGGTLGSRWLAAGQDVVYGSRAASDEGREARSRPAGPGGAPQRPIGDALADADVVLLAVPGAAVADILREHGAALALRTVVDATNTMGGPAFNSRAAIAAAAPGARYVRAFNTLGWENFADPLPGTQ